MDFVPASAEVKRGGHMDEDQIKLVRELCTQAGMIMEDASAAAILVGSLDAAGLTSVIALVRRELTRALALVDGARAMMEVEG